ncbi:MAG TPA: MSEP-CTERM sorting domain-containing protein [Cytophagales bacterium]|nr:MSEP-CTERM sorting domain-containing protein [Cytophagales bacterium]
MKALVKPYWIFIFVVLPQILLGALLFSAFSIIESLLKPGNLQQITHFAIILGLGVVGFGLLSILTIFLRKTVHRLWTGLSLILYYSFCIYFFISHMDMIPWSIPQWMISQNDIFKYVITCSMPPLMYGLLLLTLYFTPAEKSYKVWKSFVGMAAIPLFWYLFFVLILPLIRTGAVKFEFVAVTLITVSTIGFLFLLIRSVYIITLKKEGFYEAYGMAIKIIFAVVLPIAGLAVNAGFDFEKNIFGNFNHWGFYLMALVNGLILCVPSLTSERINLLLFVLKSITFSFTFYFFLVFLPFLPLSMLAIIAVGLGFLMLTPCILFIIHIQELNKHFQKLKLKYSLWLLNLALIAGFSVFPIAVTIKYLHDRSNLHIALDYIYEPNFQDKTPIDISSVSSVLKHIHGNKKNNQTFIENQTPYLTTYYNWLVLDNLTLSDQKLRLMEKLFLGESNTPVEILDSLKKDEQVRISNLNSRTQYDSANHCWKTWVDLEIENLKDFRGEYTSKIHLPEGCWMSNYYLFVEGKKKFGLLAEKKTAQWIYSQIRATNRDPGILYYTGSNEVMFRIFPFVGKEIRKTGIEFSHYEPLLLSIDGNKIALGESGKVPEIYEGGNIVYLPSAIKTSLPKVKRTPYLHFILDCSQPVSSGTTTPIKASLGAANSPVKKEKTKKEKLNTATKLIDAFLSKNQVSSKDAVISFTDYRTQTTSLKDNWQQKFNESQFGGGFFLERTIKETLIENYLNSSDNYPVFVVISDEIEKAINTNSLPNIPYTYPEGPSYYHLKETGALNLHSFTQTAFSKPIEEDVKEIITPQVHTWKAEKYKKYLPVNGEGSILVKDVNKIGNNITGKTLLDNAFQLNAMDLKLNLQPHETKNLWLPIVKASFTTKIMTPQTSYLVVENEAQEKALLAKQNLVLKGKNSLDIADQEIQMSEPELWILVVLIVLFMLWRKVKFNTKYQKAN